MEFRPSTPERDLMSDATQLEVQAALLSGEFITDKQRLNVLVESLTEEQELDVAQTVRTLETSSPHVAALFKADIGLLRPARLGEHTEADLGGFEHDYRQLFADEPESLQIMRFASLARDSGKSLCNKAEGENSKQTLYNQIVTDAMLDVVDSEVMAEDAKEVIRLLITFDVVGSALRGVFDQAHLDELRSKWPARFAHRLADFVTVSYLSDASAHTLHRQFTDTVTGEQRPTVTPDDKTLDFLFDAPSENEPLTLVQPYRRVVAALFPDRDVTYDLMHDDSIEASPPKREYIYTTEADGIWSADMQVAPERYEIVKQQIETFAMTTGFPISAYLEKNREGLVNTVTILRDPSHRFGTLSPADHDLAVEAMSESLGWQLLPKEPDTDPEISACIGLLEGYDEQSGILHTPAEALALLLEHSQNIDWRTKPTTLVSARRVAAESGKIELQSWNEEVLHVRGTAQATDISSSSALDGVKDLASRLNQHRLFVEDKSSDKTLAFSA